MRRCSFPSPASLSFNSLTLSVLPRGEPPKHPGDRRHRETLGPATARSAGIRSPPRRPAVSRAYRPCRKPLAPPPCFIGTPCFLFCSATSASTIIQSTGALVAFGCGCFVCCFMETSPSTTTSPLARQVPHRTPSTRTSRTRQVHLRACTTTDPGCV